MTLAQHQTLEPQRLDDAAFQQLAAVPPEAEWFANCRNPSTRKAHQTDRQAFFASASIDTPDGITRITGMHVIAWRNHPA